MEIASLFMAMFKPLLWLLPLLVLGGVLTSPWFKGLLGEHTVRRLIARRLDSSIYRAFSDVTIRAEDGASTQIDHIYVSPFGILVIETKNMKGWIFGGANRAEWKQVIHRSNFNFQNPLRQNHRHIKALESLLGLPFGVFKSVIVFTGNCSFKTEMPDEVCTCSDLIEYIRSIDEPILSDEQISEACDRIRSMRLERSWRTHRDHLDSLRRRHRAAMPSVPAAEAPGLTLQRNMLLADSPSRFAPNARLSHNLVGRQGQDWGPPIFIAAVVLVLMVSCIRHMVGPPDRKASVAKPRNHALQRPQAARSEPVVVRSSGTTTRPTVVVDVPRPRVQTAAEAREAEQRADEAMRVIEASTPEM
jgi:hypothetical protein